MTDDEKVFNVPELEVYQREVINHRGVSTFAATCTRTRLRASGPS
jgi:hypothetical protein